MLRRGSQNLWYRAACVVLLATAAHAQEQGTIAAPPPLMDRITPHEGADEGMLSTHPVKKATPLPWQGAAPSAPLAAAAPTTPSAPKPNSYMPFGRGSAPLGAEIPAGPHTAAAAPVSDVDAVEASEPAPPEPPEEGADPVKEDASTPTEMNAPIFDNVSDAGGPRKMLVRVLNKVTAQSTLFRAKPGDVVPFGNLRVHTLMCRVSAPTSQADSAALLDVREVAAGKDGEKPLFRGWMYQSSPSITALEHPVYDVTMEGCEIAALAPKQEEKTEKSDKSADKKPLPKKKN